MNTIYLILMVALGVYVCITLYKLAFSDFNLIEGFTVSLLLLNGGSTLLLFVLGILGLKLNSTLITILTLLALLLSLLLCLRNHYGKIIQLKEVDVFFEYFSKMSATERVLLSLILIMLVLILIINIYWPLSVWDVLALYDFRAKAILITGTFSSFTQMGPYYLTHPLFTTLTHLWLYLIGFTNVQFVYALYYVMLATLFYSLLSRNTSSTISLLFTLLLICSYPIIGSIDNAYANFPYTLYFVVGALYLFNYLKYGGKKILAISSLFIALSVWTRALEPYWLICALPIMFAAYRDKKMWKFFVYVTPILIVLIAWRIFSHSVGGGNLDINSGYVAGQVAAINFQSVFSVLLKNIVFTYNNFIRYNQILLITYILSLVINWKDKYKYYSIFYISGLILISIGGSFVYYFMVGEANWNQLGDSLSRMSIILIPLLLYFIGENISGYVNSVSTNKQ